MTSDVLQVPVEDHNAHALTLPLWQSHQRVRAIQIGSIEDVDGRKYRYLLTPADPSIPPFEVERIYFHKHNPVAGGYYVVHEDGYKEAITQEEFRKNYSFLSKPISTPAAENVILDHTTRLQMAIVLLQSGTPEQQHESLRFLNDHLTQKLTGS